MLRDGYLRQQNSRRYFIPFEKRSSTLRRTTNFKMSILMTLLGLGILTATDFLFCGPPVKYTDTCDRICPQTETSPVCGNDWKTYESECEMRKSACRTGTPLIAVYKGRCTSTLAGSIREDGIGDRFGCIRIKCDYEHRPVCGSDLQRYSNPCHIIKRACFSRTPIIKVMDVPRTHYGECSELSCPSCADPQPLEVPWCGNDRVSYPTFCHMRAAACQRRKAIVALYAGNCAPAEETMTTTEETLARAMNISEIVRPSLE